MVYGVKNIEGSTTVLHLDLGTDLLAVERFPKGIYDGEYTKDGEEGKNRGKVKVE